jgi:hypothetical protein
MPRRRPSAPTVVRPAAPAGQSRISVADVVVRQNPGIMIPSGKINDPKGPDVLHLPQVRPPEVGKPVKTASGLEIPAEVAHTQIEGGLTVAEVWEEAKKNTDYYLQKALDDNCRKFWFQYPRHRMQYSEFVLIDPPMAEDLFKFAAPNRNWTEETVDMYARDITNGRWIRTHESFGIDEQLRFYDGQQRAKAIIKAGKPWPIYVTWNCDSAAILACDSGRPRNVRQKMKLIMPDTALSGRLAAVCRSAMRGSGTTHIKYSVQDLGEFALKHKAALEWLEEHWDMKSRADVTAAVLKGHLWYGVEPLRTFCDQYTRIVFDEGSPARALHTYMTGMRAKVDSPNIIYAKACNAVSKAANGEKITALYEGSDIFEWVGVWDVPPDAPANRK